MKFKTRLILAFLLVASFAVQLGGVGFFFSNKINERVDAISQTDLVKSESASNVIYQLQRIKSNLRELFLELNDHHSQTDALDDKDLLEAKHAIHVIQSNIISLQDSLETWQKAIAKDLRNIGYMKNTTSEKPKEWLAFMELKEGIYQFMEDVTLLMANFDDLAPIFSNPNRQDFLYLEFEEEIEPTSRVLQKIAFNLSLEAKLKLDHHFSDIRKFLDLSTAGSLVLSIIAFLIAIIIGLVSAKKISTPIETLKKAAEAFGKGELDTTIEIQSTDEVGQLASSFKTMIMDLGTQTTALEQANAYTENILKSMTDTLMVVSSQGIIERINRLDMLGFPEHEVTGQEATQFFKIVPITEEPYTEEETSPSFSQLTNSGTIEATLTQKKGTRIPVLISLSKTINLISQQERVILVIKEISKIKQFQKELEDARQLAEAASRSKSFFVANMSHEIRTPMNAILGMTHLCLQTKTTPRQQDYLEKIHGAGKALLRIINDILDFSKIEAGKMDMESIPFHLHDVLKDLATLITTKAQEKKIELVFVTARGVPRLLLGDPTRLGQILTNLTNNAVKFTHSGEIVLRVEKTSETKDLVTLTFSIQDTGIGMSPDQVDKLFQPFSQADGSTTRKYGGTGLGLTICKRLVEIMGGTISIQSEIDKGSIFSFTSCFGLLTHTKKRAMELPDDIRAKRILLVDDNPTSRETLTASLESFSFQVTSVSSGIAALLQLETDRLTNPYDLIVLDWDMPNMSGIQTFQCIKSTPSSLKIPTLFMVPHSGQESVKQTIGPLQPEAYIDKPIQISTLFDTIMNLFGKAVLLPPLEKREDFLSQPLNKNIRGARVLLVEDNEINQQVGHELLDMAGVKVQIANNGQEALDLIIDSESTSSFDLVLMDIQMPVMDGYQATEEVRKMERHQTLPIVAMTANVMVEDLAKCWKMGMNDHVAKPIEPHKLFAVLNKWIQPQIENQNLTELDEQKEENPLEETLQPLPPLPGIDILTGLYRSGGNENLFKSLLRKFAEQNSNWFETMQKAMDNKDRVLALRMVHTLKGVSATIGALELQTMAELLESKLKEDNSPQEPLFSKEFKKEFKLVLNSIKKLQPIPTQARSSNTKTIDTSLLLETLESLISPIDKRRPKACHPFLEQLSEMGMPSEMESDRDKLTLNVKKYKFKEAEAVLNAMMTQLKQTP